MSESYADLLAATALSATNADFIETLYQQYLSDPKSVDPGWARYFAGLKSKVAVQTGATRTFAAQLAQPAAADTGAASAKQAAVSRLIQISANRGHLIANLDPLGLLERAKPYILNPGYF